MGEYFVYAIKSVKYSRIYVGISSDLERRLKEHSWGRTPSIKSYRPWLIIYKNIFSSRIQARIEEKRLKSGCGKEFLKSIK